MVSLHGKNILAFETSWSVTVSIVSYPCDCGNLVMKSMAMVWNGRELVGVMGNSGGWVGCVLILFIWQVTHPLM